METANYARPPTKPVVKMSKIKKLFQILQAVRREGRLSSAINSHIHSITSGVKYLFLNPAKGHISLHCPEYIKEDKNEEKLKANWNGYPPFLLLGK